MLRFIFIIGTISLLFSCQRLERQSNESAEQMFSSKDNSNLLDQNNPFRMRDSIKHFAIIPNIPLNAKLKILKSLQDSLQKQISSTNKQKFSEIEKYNYLIIKYISNLVEKHNISPRRLSNKHIKYLQSSDGKIGILSWNENTGSAFNSFINIVTYRTSKNKTKTVHLEWINQRFEYPPFAGEIKKIHRILYSSEKNIYLLYSEGIGCSNCLNKAFISLVLEKDTIDMNYPLFINQSDLLIETKNDNLLQFEYKPSSREIFLKLVNDTLIDTEFFPVDTISNLWKFDGQFFQSIVPESEKTILN